MDEKKDLPPGHIPGEDPRMAQLAKRMEDAHAEDSKKNTHPPLTEEQVFEARVEHQANKVEDILSGIFGHKVKPASAQASAEAFPANPQGMASNAQGVDFPLGEDTSPPAPPPPPRQPPSGGDGEGSNNGRRPPMNQRELVHEYVRPWIPVFWIFAGIIGLLTVLYVAHVESQDSPEVKQSRYMKETMRQEAAKKEAEARIEAEKTKQLQLQYGNASHPPRGDSGAFFVTTQMQNDGWKSKVSYRVYEFEFRPGFALTFRPGDTKPKSLVGKYNLTSADGVTLCQTFDQSGSNFSTSDCADFLKNAPSSFDVWYKQGNIFINY